MILPKAEFYAWDIETAINGKIVEYPSMLSCSNGTDTFVAIDEENIRSLAEALRDSGSQLVTWNGWAFDEPVMKKWGIEMPVSHDGMVMAYFDDETQALGLEACAVKYLGVKGWKGNDWKTFDPNSIQAAEYAARDARYTIEVYRTIKRNLVGRMATIEKIIAPAWRALQRQSERGIWIDPVAVRRERQNAERIRDMSLGSILHRAGKDFNPSSPKQLADYFLSQGVKLPLTEKGTPSTNVGVLRELDHPLAKDILSYRGAFKTLSTYVKPYEDIIQNGDGRVHPNYTLVRTLTGRSSARNTNVQNLPRQYKDFFGAPAGNIFVEVDYSAIEFRIAGWIAKEEVILESYKNDPNWDPHRFFASLFYDKHLDNVTKDERQIAKSANFGLLYLGNGFTLVNYAKNMGLELSIVEGDNLYRFFHETYPGFRRFYAETKEELIKTGQSKCPTGHIRHFGDFKLIPDYLKKETLNQAVNVKVQNTAAHLAYIAMARINDLDLPCTGFIHDALLFEFSSEEEVQLTLPKIEEAMCTWPVEFLKENFDINLDIPICIESKVRRNNGPS